MRQVTLVAGAIVAAVLTACGGGSDDAPPPAGGGGVAALSISGVAATGAAIAGRPVEVRCATGTGSGTTLTDGSYTVQIPAGVLPCVLQLTTTGGVRLSSLAWGSGASAIAHLTPFTEFVLAALTGMASAGYFSAFDATAAAALNASALDAALARVASTLALAGVDVSGAGNLLNGPLVATAGNAYDQLLDALATTMASAGVDVATVSQTFATAATGARAAEGATAYLPADLVLRPKAATCAGLASGTYRLIRPTPGATSADAQTHTITVDATGLVLHDRGSAIALTPAEPCRFTTSAPTAGEVMVSPAGVLVLRMADGGGVYRASLAFPEQARTLAELVGTWNALGTRRNVANTGYNGISATTMVDASGGQSSFWCEDAATRSVANCVTLTSGLPVLSAHATSGFDLTLNGVVVGRAFAYRAGNGAQLMATVEGDGGVRVAIARGNPLTPELFPHFRIWSVNVDTAWEASVPANSVGFTATAVDTVAQTVTRVSDVDGHVETLQYNVPRAGYIYRAAGTAVSSAGTTVLVRELTSLGRIRANFGINVVWRPDLGRAGAPGVFEFDVERP